MKKVYILDPFEAVQHAVKIPTIIDILINRAIPTAIMKVRCFEEKSGVGLLEVEELETCRVLCTYFIDDIVILTISSKMLSELSNFDMEFALFCSSNEG